MSGKPEERTLGILSPGDVDELLDVADFLGLNGRDSLAHRRAQRQGEVVLAMADSWGRS